MSTPPKPTQFEGDIGRLIPQLEREGPEQTIQVGSDDLVKRYKVTMGNFLKSIQTNQIDGNKRDETTPFAPNDVLSKHNEGKFFDLNTQGDVQNLKNIVEAIKTDLSTEEILRTIEGKPNSTSYLYEAPPVEKNPATVATSRVLSTNRFSPQSPYMTGGRITKEFASVPKGFGVSESTETMSFDRLRKVGFSLMLRATGELGSLRIGGGPPGDPTKPLQVLGSLLPGRSQLGIPVGARDLYAQEAFGAPGVDRERIPNVTLREEGASPYTSYGQSNNMYEPFNGLNGLSTVALSIVLVLAIRALVTGFALALGGVPLRGGGTATRHPSEMTKGVYKEASDSKFRSQAFRFMGLVDVDRPWAFAVREGVQVFFDWTPGRFGASLLRVSESRGFYINMIRVIIQNFTGIITAMVDASRQPTPVERATAAMRIFELLRSSKIISFMNIMAQIGDKSLLGQEKAKEDQKRPNAVNFSILRVKDDKPEQGLQKGTLGWRTTSAPAALLLPSSVQTAVSELNIKGEYGTYDNVRNRLGHEKLQQFEKRFSHEDVKNFEKYIEGSQYVPFYFQDLRTNEIISFHAFITSVDESFTPNYASSTPYGRIDPVMTYTNTTRTFTLNFKVVATDEEDLKSMYVKLNKFVTLVYPQWSQGRTVETSTGLKFTQPFSQTISASPLVRIRLGDLYKTNFSNIALARLFGLGQEGILDIKKQTSDAELRKKVVSQLNKLKSSPYTPQAIVKLNAGVNELGSFTLRPDSEIENILVENAPNSRDWREAGRPMKIVTIVAPGEENIYTATFETNDAKLNQYTTTITDSQIDDFHPLEIENRVALLAAAAAQGPSSIGEFFDFGGDKNAIVKSFKNTHGKGLAGFITSLGMGWNIALENGKWNIDPSQQVPMICDINLQFTVIHDIQPGLDSDGFNRAPLYNVKGANPHYED